MPARPTGTVTFLFTDIEGSTRLWERDEALAREAVARHDALLRAEIEGRGGFVFKTVGDAFCAAFSSAGDALGAAASAQRAVSAASAFPFRVRMALHAGTAEERDDDYFGPTVNRVARLQSLASGGQVLLSAAAESLVKDALPAGLSLRDLGVHRLKDLQRAERVFQVAGPGLPDGFPPLSGIDAYPNNLPLQLTSLVGREKDVEEVRALVGTHRLVTLTGAGGAGKTRLALEVAAEALGDFPGGVWLVELAPVADPREVPQALAVALRVREEPGRALLATVADALKTRKALLVLDNCEHMLHAATSLAETILASCPFVRLIATSREALAAAGELSWRVPSLDVPVAGSTAESLRASSAVALFLERAGALGVRPREFDLEDVAEICRRLDGIPLAIELAAARAGVLSPRQIADRLSDRFRLLTGGRRTALPRQQTLKAAIDWGYDLLLPVERVALRRLSAFIGGFDLDAAEAVVAGPSSEGAIDFADVLDLLARLVAKSFVVADEGGPRGTRYRMLETVRQYARDRLPESGEAAPVRDRHRDFFRTLAERAEPEFFGKDVASWLDRIDAEDGNIGAALEWCSEGAEATTAGLAIAAAVSRHAEIRGRFAEGRARIDALLARAGAGVRSKLVAKATVASGSLALQVLDLDAAGSRFDEALQISTRLADAAGVANAELGLAKVAFRRGELDAALRLGAKVVDARRALGDVQGTAHALINLGMFHVERGDVKAARVCYEEGIPLIRASGDIATSALALGYLAYLSYFERDYVRARAWIEEQIAECRRLGDRTTLANALNTYGAILDASGDTPAAKAAFEESFSLREALGMRRMAAASLGNLATLASYERDFAAARAYLARALVIAKESPDVWPRARAVGRFALMENDAGHHERATRILAAVEAAIGEEKFSRSAQDRRDYDGVREKLRTALGDEAYEAARAAGRAMTLDEAEALALGG